MGYLIGGNDGLYIAFFLSLAMNFFSYFYCDRFVLSTYKAKPLPEDKFSHVYKMVGELAKEYNIPMPKLWYIETSVANAFATGRNPEHGHVAVTQGILDILDPRELRGVLAHELGHIKNRDILVSSIAVTLASAIGILANTMRWSSFASQEQRSNGLSVLIVSLIMPIAASLIHLGISRSREYLADESGAHASQDPLALASALQKLENSVKQINLTPKTAQQATAASLFIVYPFTKTSLNNLFSTHPPMEQRIARLQEMARQRR